jgi:putative holliday junction resolvase
LALRFLGVDLGDRRIGVALSDPEGWLASGLTVLYRTSLDRDLAALGDLIRQHGAEAVVLGLPRRLDGSLGPQAQKTLAFGQALQRRLSVEIIYWDERLTTADAELAMIEAGVSRAKRKKKVDLVAAAIILQSYLDHLAELRREEYRKRSDRGANGESLT